jgi:uncharacterized membrane protein
MEALKEIAIVLVAIVVMIFLLVGAFKLHDECNHGKKASCEALDDLADEMMDVD